jgi:hypothetical protein
MANISPSNQSSNVSPNPNTATTLINFFAPVILVTLGSLTDILSWGDKSIATIVNGVFCVIIVVLLASICASSTFSVLLAYKNIFYILLSLISPLFLFFLGLQFGMRFYPSISSYYDDKNQLSISETSHFVYIWGNNDFEMYGGEVNFQSGSKEGTHHYDLRYSVPKGTTVITQAGITFSFDREQDLSEYKYIRMIMSFNSRDAECVWNIRDKRGNVNRYTIALGSNYSSDIFADRNGNDLIVSIPLSTYFKQLDFQHITSVSCGVNNKTPGDHRITIGDIAFLKDIK